MCLNKKVLAGLGAVALGLFLVRPAWAGAALPILLVMACPLSMVFMMRGMNNGQGQKSQDKQGQSGGSCCTGQETGTPDSTEADVSDQIKTLQAELRSLKAAQARQDDTVRAEDAEAVELTKKPDADARP
jgi:hypothetical protein